MADSCEMTLSVDEWLNIFEMKKFVDDGMFWKMKITLIYQEKNTFTTRTNGGSISMERNLTSYHWENVMTSTKRCLHQPVYTENLEDNNSGPHPTGSTSNGPASSSSSTRWKWQESLWISSQFKKNQARRGKQRFVIDRGNPLFTEFWQKISDKWLSRTHSFLLQIDRSQLT